MFVLTDMEWMTNKDGHHSPTQIAAIKVNEQWQKTAEFQSFIRPRDPEFYNWSHVSYTGGTAYEFLHARNAYSVFEEFENWLNEDDTILWWHTESEKLFRMLVSLILKRMEPHKAVSVNNYIYELLRGQQYSRGSSYEIAEGRGINTHSELKHNSYNDVLVMRALMEKLSFPQADLLKPLVRRSKPPKWAHKHHLSRCNMIAKPARYIKKNVLCWLTVLYQHVAISIGANRSVKAIVLVTAAKENIILL